MDWYGTELLNQGQSPHRVPYTMDTEVEPRNTPSNDPPLSPSPATFYPEVAEHTYTLSAPQRKGPLHVHLLSQSVRSVAESCIISQLNGPKLLRSEANVFPAFAPDERGLKRIGNGTTQRREATEGVVWMPLTFSFFFGTPKR